MRYPEMRLLLGFLMVAHLGEAATEAITTIPTTPVATTTWPSTTMPISTSTTTATTITSTSASGITTTAMTTAGGFVATTWIAEIPFCDPPCSTDEVCTVTAIVGQTVCQCNDTFYLHADRSQIVPIVDCQEAAMRVSVSRCLLERFQYSASNRHLLVNSPACLRYIDEIVVTNVSMLLIEVPLQNGNCGTTFSVHGGMVTYTNALYIPPDFTLPTIISSALNMSFSCTYNMTMQTSLQTVLHPSMGTVTPPDVKSAGTFQVFMSLLNDENQTLTVGSPIYIGITTTFDDGDTFTLRAERCVAAPSNASYDTNGVDLITDGCVLNQDVNVQYGQYEQNGESLHVVIKMDAFVFQDMPDVYIRCDVRLCKKETPDACTCPIS